MTSLRLTHCVAVTPSRSPVTLLLALVLWGTASANAVAAPTLQLPWPAGQQHRTHGGDTYNCGQYHHGRTRYALDFQFSVGQPVSAVAAGTARRGTSRSALGTFVWISHGQGGPTTPCVGGPSHEVERVAHSCARASATAPGASRPSRVYAVEYRGMCRDRAWSERASNHGSSTTSR